MLNLGKWITLISLALAVLCALPIVLYGEFGPAHGNPVGLGLLMVFGSPLFLLSSLIGSIIWVAAIIQRRK